MSRSFIDRFFVLSFFYLLIFLLTIESSAQATTLPPREQLFASAEETMLSAMKNKAEIYSPNSFSNAMEYYNDAKKAYQNGDDLSDIEESLGKSLSYFEKAAKQAILASDYFSQTISAREDCLRVDGPTYEIEKWNNAEQLFQKAAGDLEDGDKEDAKEKSEETEKLYREIELFSIQSRYLQNVWSLLEKADDMGVKKYAPATYEKARKLAEQAASLFRKNRYDKKEAPDLADQATYEIKHAIHLYQKIKQMEEKDQPIETVILSMEDSIRKIASEVDIHPRFDQGVGPPTEIIIDTIGKLKKTNHVLSQEIEDVKNEYFKNLAQKDTEIYNFQNQILKMNDQLTRLSSTKNKLQSKVEKERSRQKKLTRIGLLFSPAEAKVLLDGEKVIIRLHGLSFPIGKAVIEPQYFNLLSRTISAIDEFPGCVITIEGHTDSRGSDQVNQTLSEERAKAVTEYIVSNSTISAERIQDVGYGEARPIASNENSEGQAMNRRIDVIIQPSK